MGDSERDHSDKQIFESYLDFPYLTSLKDKVVAITGTSVGSIGFYTAKAAIAKGSKCVILLNREGSNALYAERELKQYATEMAVDDDNLCTVATIACDLSNLFWVKSAAAILRKICDDLGGLDVLVNCAGICGMRDERTTDGFDIQIQVNHLSHVLLTMLLMESLECAASTAGEARVIMVTCPSRGIPNQMLKAEYFTKCDPGMLGGDNTWLLGDLWMHKGPFTRYQQSKLANACFGMALHMKLRETKSKVKVIVADPGLSKSNMTNRSHEAGMMSHSTTKSLNYLSKSPVVGVLSVLVASFGPSQSCQSGDMFLPAKASTGLPFKVVASGTPVVVGKEKLSCHPTNISKIWNVCEVALETKFEYKKNDSDTIFIGMSNDDKFFENITQANGMDANRVKFTSASSMEVRHG